MNKFLFILLLSLSAYSQIPKGYVDPNLQEYVDDFVYEAERRNINGEFHVKMIDSIVFKRLDPFLLGLYYQKKECDIHK